MPAICSITTHQISDIQRYAGGVLVVYDDDQHLFYSDDLLREVSPKAQELSVQESSD